jgi:saccharopine dehydrogenase-like NADP-dependent oxidoreductase
MEIRKILILGAGKSSISLIDYLVEHAQTERWTITVADISAELALLKTKGRPATSAIAIDLNQDSERQALLQAHDIIISMLPAALHLTIAKDCLQLSKNLVTPSYISPAMKELENEVEKNGLLFMNEMGLDPGIDHMSAMQIIDRLHQDGNQIVGFRSHCGGLVAPESDTNSWHYKFSWNPRNVVLAGQGDGGIRWKENGSIQEINYEQLFTSTASIDLGKDGLYESYPNRDSLKYIAEYGLENIETMYRGTLRVPPFCKGWNALVQSGFTKANGSVPFLKEDAITDETLKTLLKEIDVLEISNSDKNAADFLQQQLEQKWAMQTTDKDLVVMVHEIEYLRENQKHRLQSSLYLKGKDSEHTAMALTVGLPIAIVTKLILNNKLQRTGILMPKYADIYEPVLEELKAYGVSFVEKEM